MLALGANDLLGMFKVDKHVILFRNTDVSYTILCGFSNQNYEGRMEFAREMVEVWDNGTDDKPSNVLVLPLSALPMLPEALPAEVIIAMEGYRLRTGDYGDAPMLDDDGYPLDPAAAMEAVARARR